MRRSVKSTFGSRKSGKLSERIASAGAASKQRREVMSITTRGLSFAPVGTVFGRSSFQEVKFFDVDIASTVAGLPIVSTPPSGAEPAAAFVGITELNCVQQGPTSYNRIGTKIQIRSIQFSCFFQVAGDNATHNTVRYMIVHDQQPNSAFPVISDVLSSNISTAPTLFSGVNMANRSRFTVLRDRYVDLDKDCHNQVSVKEFIRCNIETQYRTTAGAIGDITTGAIYLIAFVADKSPQQYLQMQSAHSRIRYYD